MSLAVHLVVLLGAVQLAATPRLAPEIESVGYETAVTTRVFEVLDVDFARGRVLFRHVFVPLHDAARDDPAFVDCAYPSLSSMESEIVGVYDVTRDAYDTIFVVHPPATSHEACATSEEIATTRAALAAFVAAEGLSLTARPRGIGPTPRGDAFVVVVDGTPGRVRTETRRATQDEIDAAGGSALPVALGRLFVGDTLVHERLQPLDDTRPVGREIDFLALYVDGARAIALERFSHRRDGHPPRTLFRFSPVIDATGAPVPTSDDARSDPASAPSDDGGSCADRPFLSCGLLACVAPIFSGCVCASCCLSACDASTWDDLFEDDGAPDDDEPSEEAPPDKGREGGDQLARVMRY